MNRPLIELLHTRALSHQAADEYRAGHYGWEGGGACAVGCSVRDLVESGDLSDDTDFADHDALADATGMDVRVWHLIDRIFESLPAEERAAFPPLVFKAMLDGDGDTERAMWRWLAWLLSTGGPAGQRNEHPCVVAVRVLCERAVAGDLSSPDEWAAVALTAAAGAAWAAEAGAEAEAVWVAVALTAEAATAEGATWAQMRDALLRELAGGALTPCGAESERQMSEPQHSSSEHKDRRLTVATEILAARLTTDMAEEFTIDDLVYLSVRDAEVLMRYNEETP